MKIFIKTNFLCKNSYFLNNYVQFSHPPNNIFIFPIKRSKKNSSFLTKQRVKSSLKKYYYYYKIWNLSNCCNLKLLSSLKNTGLILELKNERSKSLKLVKELATRLTKELNIKTKRFMGEEFCHLVGEEDPFLRLNALRLHP